MEPSLVMKFQVSILYNGLFHRYLSIAQQFLPLSFLNSLSQEENNPAKSQTDWIHITILTQK